ncbi:uncharacterized protein LOC113280825 [Papaver somniferum]|uniref:uncharacterized protein LOC113280825 n=1 Tax=Papaver somniferum TaxID=3469 RepID=UPI000E702D4A|nr:uncharacterized protein LOC113280825 [Papaver somniferum]
MVAYEEPNIRGCSSFASFTSEQKIESINIVPVWMILRGVPLHLWNATGFSKIASFVGKPIMTDTPTVMKTKMAFAKICVEIDADCKYPTKFPFRIDDKKYEVTAEYSWKPSSCCHCKNFGHLSHNCGSNSKSKHTKKWVPPIAPSTTGEPSSVTNETSQDYEIRVEDGNVDEGKFLWQLWLISPNSFEALSGEHESVSEEDLQNDSEIREELSEDGNGMEEIAIQDVNESDKVHGEENALKDKPCGGSKRQSKDIFSELALEYENRKPMVAKSRKTPKIEKEMKKLGVKYDCSHEVLGRGHMKSAKNKY